MKRTGCLALLSVVLLFLTGGCVWTGKTAAVHPYAFSYSPVNALGVKKQLEAQSPRVFRKRSAPAVDAGGYRDTTHQQGLLHRKRAEQMAKPLLDEIKRAAAYLDGALEGAPSVLVSLNAKDAPLVDVLKILCDKANVSLVISDLEEDKKISMSFHNMPFNKALRVVADAVKISVRYKDGVVTARSRETLTLKLPLFFFNEGGSFSSAGVNFSVSSSFSNELLNPLKQILGQEGNALLDEGSGFLVLSGPPCLLKEALNFVYRFAADMTEYLALKVFIIRVNNKRISDRGVSFEDILSFYGHGFFMNYAPGMANNPLFTIKIRKGALQAFISTLESHEMAEVLSAPFIVVRNNSVAGIKLTSQVGWVEPGDYTVTTNANTSVGQQGKPSFKTQDVGLTVTVHPRVVSDDRIQAVITLESTNLETFITSQWQPAKDAPTFDLKYPLISERSFTTQVINRPGEFVVLGGFKEQRQNAVRRGAPLVNNIPLLGDLTGKREETKENSTLYLILGFLPLDYFSGDVSGVTGTLENHLTIPLQP